MNIGVFADFRFLSSATPTGVGKHILHMTQGLGKMPDISLFALATGDQAHLRALPNVPVRIIPAAWKLAEACWTLAGRPYADPWCGSLDWVYCPKNDFIPIRGIRVAVTIHGAAELDPLMPKPKSLGAYLNRIRRSIGYRRMVSQAAVILTVSEFLKRQIVDWFGANPLKVHVVGNGVEQDYFEAAKRPLGLSGFSSSQPFVLSVGGLNYLDGGDRILRVAEVMATRCAEARFLVAGLQHDPGLKAWSSSLSNVKLLGYVPAAQLASLMRDAVALFYPTRYETFGIAAAEAMAVGTPVLTCRSTAVTEVVGEAGLYANAENADENVEMLLSLMNNDRLRETFSVEGRSRATQFTWQSCVNRLRKVLST